MTPWLLIPVKAFDAGKSRLRAALADDARRALNEYFLRRMLATASRFPGAARTAVISECERVLRAAAGWGVRTIPQRSGPGLNRAAREGVDHLSRLGAARIILIACDVPTVRPADLRELADFAPQDRSVVICPDKQGRGTNALGLAAGTRMDFRFGEGSFSAHCRAAAHAGLVPRPHHNPRIALDIDTPEDLVLWSGAHGGLEDTGKLRIEAHLSRTIQEQQAPFPHSSPIPAECVSR
jgi:2-phospho-L-lactate guanylyltransferase